MAVQAKASIDERYLTVLEVAERLKVNDETVRRLFLNEPGVLVICFPRHGRASTERFEFRRVSFSAC
jgi:hypothetical protein